MGIGCHGYEAQHAALFCVRINLFHIVKPNSRYRLNQSIINLFHIVKPNSRYRLNQSIINLFHIVKPNSRYRLNQSVSYSET